jgi:hypothetical protein
VLFWQWIFATIAILQNIEEMGCLGPFFVCGNQIAGLVMGGSERRTGKVWKNF